MDRLIAEALTTQDVEIADGFATPNDALQQLATERRPRELRALIRRLRSGTTADRQLAARLLKESSLSTNATLAEAREALGAETEPTVVRWLVSALGYSRSQSALRDLRPLASHSSPEVRFQVPGALSMCAGGVFERVADALLELSHDHHDDVRWSAIYELGAWRPETADNRVRNRLAEAAAVDDAPAIRAAAVDGLSGDSRR